MRFKGQSARQCGLLTMTLSLAACGGDDSAQLGAATSVAPAAGAAGVAALPGTAAVAGTSATAGAAGPLASGAAGTGPTMMGAAGQPATVPMPVAAAGSGAHNHAGPSDPAHAAMMAAAQCRIQVSVDARDEKLSNEPMKVQAAFDSDLLEPQIVLDWMDENEFAQAHDGWHLVRKWDQTCRMSNAPADCLTAQNLTSQGLKRAPIQQGAPGDGLAFMMMHRHMIMMLKTAFPKHTMLFEGFTKVPRTTSDPENPVAGRQISWSASNITGFDTLENIEKHLDQFPSEDDLGQYIENTYRWTADNPMSPVEQPGSGLHGALHAQWSVIGSPANLIDQAVDVKNFMFWKLHGWIDNVWEKYRKAKNLRNDDPSYQNSMLEQCMEMYALQPKNRNMPAGRANPTMGGSAGSGTTAPETGYFAQNVRPMLDNTCGGCHSTVAPNAGLTLGGQGIASADIVKRVVGVKATNGEYNLIEPGAPMKSWIYLKASGDVSTATCTNACDREKMPPSGAGLNAMQLSALAQWITNGATSN